MKHRLLTNALGVTELLAFVNGTPDDAFVRHEAIVRRSRTRPKFLAAHVATPAEVEALHADVTTLFDHLIATSENRNCLPPPWASTWRERSPDQQLRYMGWYAEQQAEAVRRYDSIRESHPKRAGILADELNSLIIDGSGFGLFCLIDSVFNLGKQLLRCEFCGDVTIEERLIRSVNAKRRRYCSKECGRKGDYAGRQERGCFQESRRRRKAREESRRELLETALLEEGIDPDGPEAHGHRGALRAGQPIMGILARLAASADS